MAEEQGLSAALEGCPWCGAGDPVMNPIKGPMHPHGLHDLQAVGPYYLHCDDCGADGPPADSEADAITAWNTRSEGLPALVGEGVGDDSALPPTRTDRTGPTPAEGC